MKNKLVYGVGVNDADYSVTSYKRLAGKVTQQICPFYSRWKDMLKRCYNESAFVSHPTYKSCHVCEDWLTFSKFKQWMEGQIWKGLQLDKDLLVTGNKVYSPTTCAFVPHKINTVVGKIDAENNGSGYIGVYVEKRGKVLKYSAQVCNTRKRFGVYSDAFSAHKSWQLEKAKEIEAAICWYALQTCFRADVAESLTSKVWKLRLENSMNIKTERI